MATKKRSTRKASKTTKKSSKRVLTADQIQQGVRRVHSAYVEAMDGWVFYKAASTKAIIDYQSIPDESTWERLKALAGILESCLCDEDGAPLYNEGDLLKASPETLGEIMSAISLSGQSEEEKGEDNESDPSS